MTARPENQHYVNVSAHATGVALLKALRMWQDSGCDCCSPTVCDDAIESLGADVELWEGFRRFGIELAQTAQNVIDQEVEEGAKAQRAVSAYSEPRPKPLARPEDHTRQR